MKKQFLLIVTVLAFSFAVACTNFRNQAGNPQIDARKDIPKDTLIKLQRTRCYGTCPAYELTIYGDGKVTFDGIYFASKSEEKKSGLIESKISQEKVKEIIKEFQKVNYFDLGESDEFSQGKCTTITDQASAITFIRYNGKEKSIDHYYGCEKAPKSLTQLEDRIDEIVNTIQWMK